jgi:hypothetical protein
MGLEDALPDGIEVSSSSSTGSNTSSADEDLVTFGVDNKKKKFTQEQWDQVKEVIKDEFDLTVGEVVDSVSPSKRYEILHEAAVIAFGDEDDDEAESEYTSTKTCACCGTGVDNTGVEIGGKHFCPQHPAIKVAKELNNGN